MAEKNARTGAKKKSSLKKVSEMPYMKEFLDGTRRILGQPDLKFKSSSVNEAYKNIVAKYLVFYNSIIGYNFRI